MTARKRKKKIDQLFVCGFSRLTDKYSRDYHKPAIKPPQPPRTREAIASRNRCAAAISAALGKPIPKLNARGEPV